MVTVNSSEREIGLISRNSQRWWRTVCRAERKAACQHRHRRQHDIVIFVVEGGGRHRLGGLGASLGDPDVRLHQEQGAGENSEGEPNVQRRLETSSICSSRTGICWSLQASIAEVTGTIVSIMLFTSVVVSQNKNNGNAGEPSGSWCLGPNTGGAWTSGVSLAKKKFEIVLCKILQTSTFLAAKMICNAVHDAFLNTNNRNGVSTCFDPLKMTPVLHVFHIFSSFQTDFVWSPRCAVV